MQFVREAPGPAGSRGGAVSGFVVGVGVAAARSLSHRLFGGQGLRVWIIDVGGDVVSLPVAGLILGAFG